MQIAKRTMNWLPSASLYDEAETARLKRKAQAQADISSSSSLSSNLIGTGTSSTTEAVNLTLRIAAARVQTGKTPKV
jgi:hypothetical protein